MRDPSKTGSFPSRAYERFGVSSSFLTLKRLIVPIFDPELIFVNMECAEKNRKSRTGLRFPSDTGTVPVLHGPLRRTLAVVPVAMAWTVRRTTHPAGMRNDR